MSQLLAVSRRGGLFVNFLRQNVRQFSTPTQPSSLQQPEQNPSASINKGTHKVDNLERKLLVWTGKYKSVDEVPSYVKQDVVERARNKFRIRVANIMMLLTLIGCGIMIVSGRKAAERGESVLKINQEWHKEYNEKALAEAKEKALATK